MKKETYPVLISDRGEKLTFFYDGKEVEGYSNETVAAALNAAGMSESGKIIRTADAAEVYIDKSLTCV